MKLSFKSSLKNLLFPILTLFFLLSSVAHSTAITENNDLKTSDVKPFHTESPAAESHIIENLKVSASITEKGVLSVEETLYVFFDGPLSKDLTRSISGHYAKSGREKNKTGFVLLNATLDGQPVKTFIQRNPDNLKLVLARKGDHFDTGLHVFKLKYELINMIVFHPEQDTLIWRLVRESAVPVVSISVDVTLPGQETERHFRLFSGQLGDMKEGEGTVVDRPGSMATQLTLEEGKSFTMNISWDKGLVMDNARTHSEWRTWDLIILGFLVFYYIFTWYRYGRSPKRETVTPSTTPPENLSPGLLRTLRGGKPDVRALTAEILNLAVKGYIHLDDFTADEKLQGKPQEKSPHNTKRNYSSLERMMGRKYRLRLSVDPENAEFMTSTENILLHNLFEKYNKTEIILDDSCIQCVKTTLRVLSRNFSELGKRFFFSHTKRWVLGLIIFQAYTAFAMFSVLSQGVGGIEPDSEHALAFMAPLFFLTPLLGGEKIWKQSMSLFILRTGIPLVFSACALAVLRQQGTDALSIAALCGSIAVIGFFWKIAPVRSEEGIHLLDKIEGFQLGLGSRADLKEGDTIEKFEALFPYAYALDRERPLIARYDPLITRLRHHARWHTADTHSFNGGAEYYSLAYELGEAIQSILPS